MLEDFETKIVKLIGSFFKYTYEKNRADIFLDDYDFEIEIYDLKPVQSKLEHFTQSIIDEIKSIKGTKYFRIDIFFKIFEEQKRKYACATIGNILKKFLRKREEIDYEDEGLILRVYFKEPSDQVGTLMTFLPLKRSIRVGKEDNFEYSFSYSGLHKIYAKNIQKKAEIKQINTDSGLLIVGLENWKPGLLCDLNDEIKIRNKGKNFSHLISEIFLIPYTYNKKKEIDIGGMLIYENLNPKTKPIETKLRNKVIKTIKSSFSKNQALKIIER